MRRSVYLTTSGALITLVALFLETMIAARLLPKQDYGIYVLLITVVNFLTIAVNFGGRITVTKMIAGSEGDQQVNIANSALVFRLLVLIISGVLIVLARPVFAAYDQQLAPYLLYIPLMLAVVSMDELLLAILQGLQRYRQMAIAQILRSVLRLVLTLAFLWVLDLGIAGLLYSWILASALAIVYEYIVLPIAKQMRMQRSLVQEMLRFGLPLQMIAFLWLLSQRVNVLVLGTFAGLESVALFAVAARIPDAMSKLSESFIAVYFPAVAALLSKGQHQQASSKLNQTLRVLSFGMGVVVLGTVVFSSEIITLFFTNAYTQSSHAFAVLMLAYHITFIVSLFGYTLTAAGFAKRSLIENAVRTGLGVLGSLILIPRFGFVGGAYAVLLSTYAVNPLDIWLLRKSKIDVQVGQYAKQTLILLMLGGGFLLYQPTQIAVKLAIVVLFIAINAVLSTISLDDIRTTLPPRVARRLQSMWRSISATRSSRA
jgi:O-antigen/teichoic acid export membrane protein